MVRGRINAVVCAESKQKLTTLVSATQGPGRGQRQTSGLIELEQRGQACAYA